MSNCQRSTSRKKIMERDTNRHTEYGHRNLKQRAANRLLRLGFGLAGHFPKLAGIVDGFNQFEDFSMWRSWDNQVKNYRYDTGVNVGQALGRTLARLTNTYEVLASRGETEPKS